MTELVHYSATGGLAILTMDNPPLNALGHGLRAAIAAALARAEADGQVEVICLTAAGSSWPVGADIREFGKPALAPTLPNLCHRLHAATKPVIAALHGTALGGGLELALAASLRVAATDTEVGLPEVTLGLLPGAGGTQRLPRLIGAERALDLILSGRRVGAAEAREIGLIDRTTAGDPVDMARSIAAAHVEGRSPLPPPGQRRLTGMDDPARYLAAVAAEAARPRPAQDLAAAQIIRCVEAAILLPEAEGHAVERAAFVDLVATPQARALRHAFFAERRAARGLPKVRPSGPGAAALARVAIVGGGAIGAGLASELIGRGVLVTLIEADGATQARARTRIARAAGQDAEGLALLSEASNPAAAAGADLVIEAVSERMEAKQAVLGALAATLAQDCPILTITCGLDPAGLRAAAGGGGRHGLLWLADPVRRTSLAELTGDPAGPAAAAAVTLARVMGWRLSRQADRPLTPLYLCALDDCADRLVALGSNPFAVDMAARALGLPLGPFELRDIYGPDHPLRHLDRRRDGVRPGDVLAGWLADNDRRGRRAGRGYHAYPGAGPKATPDPEVDARLATLRPPVSRSAAEVGAMLVAGLANAGAWAVGSGQAARPSDFDLVALSQGFPRWRGGPMQAADEEGALAVRSRLRQLAEGGDPFWQPAPLWDDLVKNGRRFADLNGD